MAENLEQKIESVLGNPELMNKIMSIAKEMGEKEQPTTMPSSVMQDASALAMIQKLSGLSQKTSIDPRQRALITALTPYLPKDRIIKLENAMRAAKMAQIASNFVSSTPFSILSGR